MQEPLAKYPDNLSAKQKDRLNRLEGLYLEWNRKINLISRRNTDNFYLHHVLHSLSISMIFKFMPGTRILDAGTGGGFPGIPLSIVLPDCEFVLADSVKKKITAVNDIIKKLGIKNAKAIWTRLENIDDSFDFVVSRAVAPFPVLVKWTAGLIRQASMNELPNGILTLKGGNLADELKDYPQCTIYDLRDYFDQEYFREKKIVYMPV
ncbi:MAG: 16S rRNA (guanine(527)-N(7))-methyltransferase RsmG [Bacteroidales bacterium]|nr:16S rRNA (guanine(527)-N(7))-methyltransferase RsmG [Bacteroidales bacterium]